MDHAEAFDLLAFGPAANGRVASRQRNEIGAPKTVLLLRAQLSQGQPIAISQKQIGVVLIAGTATLDTLIYA